MKSKKLTKSEGQFKSNWPSLFDYIFNSVGVDIDISNKETQIT